MRCHYEVLEADRSATDDELKKSYRRLALRSHPDKVRGDASELLAAEERFKELNAAYETLRDPQERQWYDDHRESILAGGDGTAGQEGTVSPTPNLWQWFRDSSYNGFADDESGFYQTYARAFEQVVKVERESGSGAGAGSGTGAAAAAPGFGTSETAPEDAERFYGYWAGFSSKLSFGWADMYNPSEGKNRFERRMIEKENKKARDAKKREYNELVRSLALFAKRRDKRMVQLQLKRQKEREERQQRHEALQEKERLRKKAQREAWIKEHEEAGGDDDVDEEPAFRLADEVDEVDDVKGKGVRDGDRDGDGDGDGEDGDEAGTRAGAAAATNGEEDGDHEDHDVVTIWRCDVCSKTFKSEKQCANHERSKKHVENVKRLNKQLREEEKLIRKKMQEDALKAKQEALKAEAMAQTAAKEGQDEGRDSEEDDDDRDESEDDESDSEDDFGAFGKRLDASSDEDEDDDDDDDDEDDDDDDDEDDEDDDDDDDDDDVEEDDEVEEQQQEQQEASEPAGTAAAGAEALPAPTPPPAPLK